MKKDYYSILGVSRSATEEEIKASYRRLAKEKHPDRFIDNDQKEKAEAEFKDITEAYSVLSDARKRREYDNPRMGRGMGGINFHFTPGGSPFGFIFEQPLEVSCSISIKEALAGARKKISYDRIDRCGSCNGTGSGNERINSVCRACGGSGYESMGFMNMPCRYCNGRGKMSMVGCGSCGASGITNVRTSVEVDLPKGCAPNTAMRMIGYGNYSKDRNGYGEMYIRISISNPDHGLYRLSFPHIVVPVPISYRTAVLGGRVRVPSPHGKIDVSIPRGTCHGTNLRVAGKGMMTSPNSGLYGDLVVSVEIDIPEIPEGEEKMLDCLDGDSVVHGKIAEYEAKMAEFDV